MNQLLFENESGSNTKYLDDYCPNRWNSHSTYANPFCSHFSVCVYAMEMLYFEYKLFPMRAVLLSQSQKGREWIFEMGIGVTRMTWHDWINERTTRRKIPRKCYQRREKNRIKECAMCWWWYKYDDWLSLMPCSFVFFLLVLCNGNKWSPAYLPLLANKVEHIPFNPEWRPLFFNGDLSTLSRH